MTILEEIKEGLPKDAMISEVLYEASEIILYTQNKEFFRNSTKPIKKIVDKIKKRIEVRADPSIIKDPEQCKKTINEIIPKEAGVKDIYFEPEFSKVIIHAEKPGLVIGKSGITLKEIKNKTLWTPQIKRAGVIESELIRRIRKMLHKEVAYRKKFLHELGKKIYGEKKEVEWIRATALGGFREVGRSCILLQTNNSSILLDCGISVGSTKKPFPYLEAPEFHIQDLDAVVLSHAHMDHSGLIPYLYSYGYKGPLYSTAPTRDLSAMLQLDYIQICQRENKKPPYDSRGIEEAIKHSIALEYGEVSDVTPDMRLTLQNAGHLLGSSTIHVHIGDGLYNVLYSGDIKFAPTTLFQPTSTDYTRVEALILESTYGSADAKQPPRKEGEKLLIDTVKETVAAGGKVLIPSFAVGRAQDVMAIITGSDIDAPIYLDGMVWDATAIHTAYPEFLSSTMRSKILHQGKNPFVDERLHAIGSQKEREQIFEKQDPYIVIATSGMLVGGPAMQYLQRFASDPKNTLIFVGYQAEGTLGSRIQKGWSQIPIEKNGKNEALELKMRIQTVEGLSGHSDQPQLINFVKKLKTKPRKILTDHGDNSRAVELARALHKVIKTETMAPHNLETVRFR
ncbi:MAG: hypothetical protein B6U68_03440 [Candidatus Aenigmarchaeota archaeon ex4484_14]|nr:MAG: hypothetical protein B6U68_03440 [Candidatus Aenigmarchaeota archaeon ex4484_14]